MASTFDDPPQFALNGEYLLNEKGATKLAYWFALRPPGYRERVESAFASLAADAGAMTRAGAILAEIEQEISRWRDDRPSA